MLAGKKQLLKKADVNSVEVPQYDELSVRRLWPELKKDAEFCSFFPATYPAGKGPPRKYFFDILNTLQPEYLAQIMDHANKQRMTAAGEDQRSQSIQISEYWEEQLKAMPYLSCKCRATPIILTFLSLYREERQDAPSVEG